MSGRRKTKKKIFKKQQQKRNKKRKKKCTLYQEKAHNIKRTQISHLL